MDIYLKRIDCEKYIHIKFKITKNSLLTIEFISYKEHLLNLFFFSKISLYCL